MKEISQSQVIKDWRIKLPEHDLLWAYLILGVVVVALAIMGAFYGLTGFFLYLAWERLRPFLPR